MQHDRKQRTIQTLGFRHQRAQACLARLQKKEARFPWLRLATLLLGLVAVYLAFALLPFAMAWLATSFLVAIFGFVAVLHRRVIDRIEQVQAFILLLETHLARARLDWPAIPPATPLDVPLEHPFAADLNVSGARSLHQLLDTTVSLGGSRRLAGWLLAETPEPDAIHHRQALLRELLARPVFRLRLELDGLRARPARDHRWDTSGIPQWLDRHTSAASLRPTLIVLGMLAAADAILFFLHALGVLPAYWIGSLALYMLIQASRFRESNEVFEEAYGLAQQLGQLRAVLTGLEKQVFATDSLLAQLCKPFTSGPQRPSAALRKIGRIASAASLRNNPFLSLIFNLLVPWDLFFAYQLERYKHELRGVLPTWLETWHELEALVALANFAALNPENTFPEVLPSTTQPILEATTVGHPLIPDGPRVTNDFSLQQLGETVIITGSNMSGKSTFLRTIGANMVLAYAGSTVAAERLRIVPFRLYTSMNVSDSLNDGISFFYAEVRRLKTLLEQLQGEHPYPLFFLIDEIFRGTNNRERQLGSRAYTEALAGKRGAGLISTHDLELAHLAESIASVRNVHFREDVLDGKMIFDYRVHPGPSPTTNALRIMALAGLPVPEGDINNVSRS